MVFDTVKLAFVRMSAQYFGRSIFAEIESNNEQVNNIHLELRYLRMPVRVEA